MKIKALQTFILHVPVTRDEIQDSAHQITHWGAPGVAILSSDGLRGFGYTGTHAHLPTDRLIVECISEAYGPLLIGREVHEVRQIWSDLYRHGPIQWVGRGGIAHLALAALDIALWDLKAKALGLPLWKLLGGAEAKRIEAYDTDGGWLNWSLERLIADCRRNVEEKGYRGVKIKVGGPNPSRDLRRVEAVRQALGPEVKVMVDANGKWDLPTAMRIGGRLKDCDVYWLEEPLWHDDLRGHATLARAIPTPIALGEQLYKLDDFRNFIEAGAVHFVQPDAVRMAGITEWWAAAELALANRLPVVPHIGDMMQAHLHLTIAHSACSMLEHIPWMRECFEEPATVKDGFFAHPRNPGAGTTLRQEALERFNVL